MFWRQTFVGLADEFVDDKGWGLPSAATELVGESNSADDVMALSLSCDPPGADAIDFLSNSWVVGTFSGMGCDGGITADKEGGADAVAGGMSTGAGRGTAICSCIGSTSAGICGLSRKDISGAFVVADAAGKFVALPTCPQTTTGPKTAAVKIPANCRAAVIVLIQLPKSRKRVQRSRWIG